MDRHERFHLIRQLLSEHRHVPLQRFLQEMEVSLATFKRDLQYLRDRFRMPILYDKDAAAYHLGADGRHELPGIWFNADEVHALLTMQQLLHELQPGLLTPRLQPLRDLLYRQFDNPYVTAAEVQRRIRLQRANTRIVAPAAFDPISSAVLARRKITIRHTHRGRNTEETRVLSPQRLTYYRDNWYLDAWCHLRDAIRCFSLDTVLQVQVMEEAALDISEDELNAVFAPGYGIFAGAAVQWATLRFSPERARWVSREIWHPQQVGEFDAAGYYVLKVPYSDDRELVMDVLRHVPHVEVMGPEELRMKVKNLLEAGLMAMSG